MTDRHSGYIIALDKDIREDDAEAIINAIRMVKGVIAVEPVVNDNHLELIATSRIKMSLFDAVRKAIYPELFKDEK